MSAAAKIVTLSSRGGWLLAVTAVVICVGTEAGYFAVGSPSQAARMAPVFAFVVVAFWLIFWAPRIVIDAAGVTVVNPFRTSRLNWTAVKSVESRWVLTLVTAGRRIAVWAAPRQRRGVTGIEVRRDSFGLPDFAAEQQFERQSDPVSAGDVAERLISQHLAETAQAQGTIDTDDSIAVRVHVISIVVLVILAVASVLVFVLH